MHIIITLCSSFFFIQERNEKKRRNHYERIIAIEHDVFCSIKIDGMSLVNDVNWVKIWKRAIGKLPAKRPYFWNIRSTSVFEHWNVFRLPTKTRELTACGSCELVWFDSFDIFIVEAMVCTWCMCKCISFCKAYSGVQFIETRCQRFSIKRCTDWRRQVTKTQKSSFDLPDALVFSICTLTHTHTHNAKLAGVAIFCSVFGFVFVELTTRIPVFNPIELLLTTFDTRFRFIWNIQKNHQIQVSFTFIQTTAAQKE